MTSIDKKTTQGETSGVLVDNGYRITVGDEGDLTITYRNEESKNFYISGHDGKGIGFEDLSLNGDTLALLDEGRGTENARVYTLSLQQLKNSMVSNSSTSPTINSFDLQGSKDLTGFTVKRGDNQGENNGYEGFTYFENGAKILAARQYSIPDNEKLSLDDANGGTYFEELKEKEYHDHIDIYNSDGIFHKSIELDDTQVRGDINSMRQTEDDNVLVMHGDASIKKEAEDEWINVNAYGNEGVLRVQNGSTLEETTAYYNLKLNDNPFFRNAEGIDIKRQENKMGGYETEITFAFDNKDGVAEAEKTYSTTVGGLNFDNDLRGAKEAIYLGSDESDVITGSSSRRTYIAGGDGNDTLTAQGDSLSKADILTGGLGVDTFCIENGNQGVIWDFDAKDKIEFDGMIFESIEAMEGFGFNCEEQTISIGGVDVETQMFTSDDSNSILYIANI